MGVVRGEPARSGGGVLGAAEAVRRGLLGPRLAQNRACAHTGTKSRESSAGGSKKRGGGRRLRLKRAAAVGVGSGRWGSERGWVRAGGRGAPCREAKNRPSARNCVCYTRGGWGEMDGDRRAGERGPGKPGGVAGGARVRARGRRAGASRVRGAAGEVGHVDRRAGRGRARTEPQKGALDRAAQGGHGSVRGTRTRSFWARNGAKGPSFEGRSPRRAQ